jgi:arsenate reductase (glutaredoxin)
MLTFLQYPKCGTCRKAKQFLDQYGVIYQSRHIVEETPSKEELQKWISLSGLPIQKFFNTRGQKYRELELSKLLPTMSEEKKLDLLASEGMLIKRPILTDGEQVTVGFKEDLYEKKWKWK